MSKKSMAARRQMRETTARGRAGGARQAPRGRTHSRNARSAGRPWGLISAVGGIVAAFVIVVIVLATLPSSLKQDVAVSPVPASLMTSITSVPSSTLKAVKGGDISNSPLNIPASYKPVALSSNGLPEIAFVGAEYCPYCALQRWSLIIGLSPFGTWSDLHLIRSSVYDSPSNLPTFTFAYGAKFTSKYVTFSSHELQSNVSINKNGSPYKSLQSVSGTVATAFTTIDTTQGYPFLDYAGKFVQLGSEATSPDVAAMVGLSWNQVAQQLRNPKSVVAKEVLGGASYVTAATCLLTGQKPGPTCNRPYIQTLEQQLEKSS